MWRLFSVGHVDGGVLLSWDHAGVPSLSPAERYVLDVAAYHSARVVVGRRFWWVDDGQIEQVSELLLDAQDDAEEAVMLAWLKWDPSFRCPTASELAKRVAVPPRRDRASPLPSPHVAPERKGGDDAS
jgi:hypothetical protein